MRCPKCDTEQPEATECRACGVIVAKAAAGAKAPRLRVDRGRAEPGFSGVWVWLAGAAVVLLCGLFWLISSLREAAPAEGVQASAARAPDALAAPDRAAESPELSPPRPNALAGIELDRERVPAVSAAWYEGAEGWDQALAEQRSNGAPAALYVRVGWCPHCRHFEREVLPADAVRRGLGRVIKVRLDPDRAPTEKELARRLGVTGYPTFRLLTGPDDAGRRIPAGSSVDAAAFARMLDEELTGIARDWVSSVKGQVTDEALATLDRAVRLAPSDAWTFIGRGLHLTRRKAFGQALEDLRRAARLAPDEPVAQDTLGWCLLEQRRYADALLIYDQLAQMTTGADRARATYMRAVCQKKLGRTEAAVQDAKAACDLGYATACRMVGQK